MPIELVMPSSHLILCRPLLLLSPFPPSIRVFSNESTFHMRWPKYWSFSFSICPSNEHPGLISFRMVYLGLIFNSNNNLRYSKLLLLSEPRAKQRLWMFYTTITIVTVKRNRRFPLVSLNIKNIISCSKNVRYFDCWSILDFN